MNSKDWFEFILDFDLLDRHLKGSLNPEPSGCSLIIQFLYHAYMTEQVYNVPSTVPVTIKSSDGQTTPASNENGQSPIHTVPSLNNLNPNNPAVELKTKRIRILRILAVKAAAILEWDMLKFEKEIPVAVMSDLLNTFLKITMNDKETNLHHQLDIKVLENHTLFALQLLHRWCLRTVIISRFPKKPPTKSIPVNMPASLNPLQNIKDANENILKSLINNVQESVDFLENLLKNLDHDICMPSSECYSNINSESGECDLLWDKAVRLELEEVKNTINYDLGMYYFQAENYQKSFEYFEKVNEYKSKAQNNLIKQFNVYTTDLESYLIACKSMLGLELDSSYQLKTSDNYTNQLVNKVVLVENSIKNNFKGLYEYILEDNKSCQLSIKYRLELEKQVINTENQVLIDQISSCNLIRLACDSFHISRQTYNFEKLKYVSEVINDIYDRLPYNSKMHLYSFIQLNHAKFNAQSRRELSKNTKFNLPVESNKRKEVDSESVIESTPSSPPPSSSLVNTLNYKDNDVLTYAKLSLQTCDQIALKNCISKYNFNITNNNQELSTHSLRFFWPSWSNEILSINTYLNESSQVISSNYISSLLKSNNLNDLDYVFISYAKINELIEIKKFENALKLFKAYESLLNSNGKSSKIYLNQQLYLFIRKYLHDYDLIESKVDFKKKNRLESLRDAFNKDQIQKMCKNYLMSLKNDFEISIEIFKLVMVFLLTTGDFNTILSNEYNFLNQPSYASHHKKLPNYPSSVTTLFNISKQLAKLCLDLNKSDKNTLRKLARELWDSIVEVFSDPTSTQPSSTKRSVTSTHDSQSSSSSAPYDASNSSSFFGSSSNNTSSTLNPNSQRDTQISYYNRELLREFFISIKNKLVKTISISLMSTLYNIGDTMANNEIFSEYRHLWPSSLANSNSLNINALNDMITSLLNNSLIELNPCNIIWLCTSADICLAKSYFSDAIKNLIQMFACETRYFFKSKILQSSISGGMVSGKSLQSGKKGSSDFTQTFQMDDKFIEKNVKSIIKSCCQLNKHTQAALFCQFLQNNDYSNAFRFLQESSLIVPTSDEMDTLYNCVWDNTLIEYLTNLNAMRGFLEKKNLCLKQCMSQNLNQFNPNEVLLKTIDCKKSLFFTKLINYYFLN